MSFCGKCGKPLAEAGDRFCRSCGAPLEAVAPVASTPTTTITNVTQEQPATAVPKCPQCGTERVGTRPYCVRCGLKWADGAPTGSLSGTRSAAAPAEGETLRHRDPTGRLGWMENWITPIWRWYRARRWWWQGLIAIGLVLVALTVLGSVLPSQDDEQGLVRSSAGVSSTPTAKRVITIPATSTPGNSSSEDALYLATMPEIATDWVSILTDFGELTGAAGNQPSLVFTSSWQSSVLDVLNEGRLMRSRVNALKPSARLTPTHQEVLAALDSFDDVDREMRAAIDSISAGDLTSASTHIESATASLSEMTSHIDTATALLPVQ